MTSVEEMQDLLSSKTLQARALEPNKSMGEHIAEVHKLVTDQIGSLPDVIREKVSEKVIEDAVKKVAIEWVKKCMNDHYEKINGVIEKEFKKMEERLKEQVNIRGEEIKKKVWEDLSNE